MRFQSCKGPLSDKFVLPWIEAALWDEGLVGGLVGWSKFLHSRPQADCACGAPEFSHWDSGLAVRQAVA